MSVTAVTAVSSRIHDGSRLSIYWPDEKQYYLAVVSSYSAKAGTYTLVYDDGDVDNDAKLDGPSALTFSILAGRCSCCGSAALRDPGHMSCCIIPAGFAAVTAGAFNVACVACKRFFCASCLPGRKPVGCEAGDPMRFMRFRKELMYDGRNWYCPQSACQQVRRVDHSEDVAAAAQAKDGLELKRKRDDDAKKQNQAWDNLQAAVDKDQKALEKKQKKAEENLQAAFDKDKKALEKAATKQEGEDFRNEMQQVVVDEARRAAELHHLPLIHDDALSACLQDLITQLREVGSKLGESRPKGEAKLPYSISEAALDAIEDKYKVGYSGSDVLLKWCAPLAAFDSFFDQPPTVDGMSWHDTFFTGWRKPMPVNNQVTQTFEGKMTLTYCMHTQTLKIACDCTRKFD
jgi:hypothetical protein